MTIEHLRQTIITIAVILLTNRVACAGPLRVDFRYMPVTWQSVICTPCDSSKTLVGKWDGRGAGFHRVPLTYPNGWVVQIFQGGRP
jgi:hypothetical protein